MVGYMLFGNVLDSERWEMTCCLIICWFGEVTSGWNPVEQIYPVRLWYNTFKTVWLMSSLYLLNHSVSVQLKLVRNQVLGIMTLDTELAHCDQAHLTDCLFFTCSTCYMLKFKLFQVISSVIFLVSSTATFFSNVSGVTHFYGHENKHSNSLWY